MPVAPREALARYSANPMPASRTQHPRACIRLVAFAGALLPGCTAPPPGHPYWPLAADNQWEYQGWQGHSTDGASTRADAYSVKALELQPGRTVAAVDEWGLGRFGAQGGELVEFVVTPQGLRIGPKDAEHTGFELPTGLATAAPWVHEIREKGGDTPMIRRSEVVGRRRITVPAGTFDAVVVRTQSDGDGDGAFVLLRDFACGIGMVRRAAQSSDGTGHEIVLADYSVVAEGARGCAVEPIDALPEYGAAEVAAAATRRCDVAALERLGAELGEHASAKSRRTLPQRLLAACAGALPPSVATLLTTGNDVGRFVREPEVEAWIAQACPNFAAIRHADARSTQNSGERFDACTLGRLAVIERDEFADTSTALVPWGLHAWFIEQGVTTSAARSITRALLAGERRKASVLAAPSTLPAGDGDTVSAGLLVEVSANELRFATARLPLGDAGQTMAALAGLKDVLDVELDRDHAVAERSGREWQPSLLLAVDGTLPARLLVTLLRELRHLEFSRHLLLVERADGRVRGLEVAFAADSIDPSPVLTVALAPDRTTIGRGPARWRSETFAPGDADALRAGATALRRDEADAHRAVISESEGVTVDEVVAAIMAVRGEDCPDECILPDVVLSSAPESGHQGVGP